MVEEQVDQPLVRNVAWVDKQFFRHIPESRLVKTGGR